MIEPPRSHAARPEPLRQAGPDLLSEMLKAVRLTGAVFLDACFSAPFGVIDPRSYNKSTPMGRLRHVSILHLIVSGSCSFMTGGEQRRVSAGELLFLPFPDAYSFWNGDSPVLIPAGDVVQPGPVEGMWRVDYGGGGAEVHMVCGFIESSEFLFAPVFRALPALIVEQTAEDKVGALIASTVREIVALTAVAAPGSQATLGRLMELLFVEVLRRYVARLAAGSTGWFAALNDPVAGRTLQLIHANPAQHWTVDEIARQVGSSRTVVTERCKALLGRSPIDYLTNWRMQLATERLLAGSGSLDAIARGVGYESEAAFIRAFKRITGVTPGKWRQTTSQGS